MTDFAAIVDDFWHHTADTAEVSYRDDTLTLLVDPIVEDSRRVSIVRRVDGPTTVVLSPNVAEQLRLDGALSEAAVLDALAEHHIDLYDADNLFYFDGATRAALVAEADASTVRKLGAEDADAFARFEASASEQDLEDAYVELDHWAVSGEFDGDRLVAAASAYPWVGVALADIGVLTLADSRGRGYARQVVRALARFAISEGYEPQYRCQLDNVASIALAKSLGLSLYGTWQIVSPDSPN